MPNEPLIPPPDTIAPAVPAETPPVKWPAESDPRSPEFSPPMPDTDTPDPGAPERPPLDPASRRGVRRLHEG